MNNLTCELQIQPCGSICFPASKQFGPQYKADKFGQQLLKFGASWPSLIASKHDSHTQQQISKTFFERKKTIIEKIL